MADGADDSDIPDDLGVALTRVRTLLAGDDGVPEQVVAWAMIIEAVDRLSTLHGPAATAGMLARLSRAVGETRETPTH